jgi:hypothetical protein
MPAPEEAHVSLTPLEPLVGDWTIAVDMGELPPGSGPARMSFSWLTGQRFLIQRWEVPILEAPDGIAIIGADPDHERGYLQHYFDSRGVERLYRMTFEDGTWRLWRDGPDFAQRYAGTVSDDGRTIDGAWEINEDGETWRRDFGIVYTRA